MLVYSSNSRNGRHLASLANQPIVLQELAQGPIIFSRANNKHTNHCLSARILSGQRTMPVFFCSCAVSLSFGHTGLSIDLRGRQFAG